jgi:type IV pilus assembly protein PilB
MGVEPFLVASSVVLILAQRLIRKICSNCKEEEKVPSQTLIDMGFSPEEVPSLRCYKGKGCNNCSNTGYKGRAAIYEVMPISDEVRELILQGASADEIKKKAISLGTKTLRLSGLQKVRDGVTTVDEVVNSTFKD